MGKAIVIIGGTGTGKTTFAKKILSSSPLPKYIYDVNNEYRVGSLLDFETFLSESLQRSNSIILFEEATIFLSNRGDEKKVKELLVRKRHSGNFVLLLFHSLRSVPTYIFDLCNFVVIFKTNDNENLISQKFKGNESILEGFREAKRSANPHFSTVKKLL